MIVGTAGWAIPRTVADAFPADGTSLQRYAARFAGVEINSSFHRPHRRTTWARWHDSVPDGFRFAVKLPKTISHERRMIDCEGLLATFLDEVAGLDGKLAILLLQLPPKLAFDEQVARPFLERLTRATDARIVCEPRHPSWFEDAPDQLLRALEIARVAADPATLPAAAQPGGWPGLVYYRLHGSPRTYYSSYPAERLEPFAAELTARCDHGPVWCMFDNTASGAAAQDALTLMRTLESRQGRTTSER